MRLFWTVIPRSGACLCFSSSLAVRHGWRGVLVEEQARRKLKRLAVSLVCDPTKEARWRARGEEI